MLKILPKTLKEKISICSKDKHIKNKPQNIFKL